jgi:hypothetical protein
MTAERLTSDHELALDRLNAVQASLAELAEAVVALLREDDRAAAEEHLAFANSYLAQAAQLQLAEER